MTALKNSPSHGTVRTDAPDDVRLLLGSREPERLWAHVSPGSDPAAEDGNNREGGGGGGGGDGGGGSSGLNTITNPDLVGKQVTVSLGCVAMVTDAPSSPDPEGNCKDCHSSHHRSDGCLLICLHNY